MLHDPLNDTMSTIKNAELVGKSSCTVKPSSELIGAVLKVMAENQYIKDFETIEDIRGGQIRIHLGGMINNCGIIKPRQAVKRVNMEKFEERFLPAQDFGVLILSTTQGVVSNNEAKRLGIGGKLLAYVY